MIPVHMELSKFTEMNVTLKTYCALPSNTREKLSPIKDTRYLIPQLYAPHPKGGSEALMWYDGRHREQ